MARSGARTNFTSFRGHAFGGPWMQEVFLPLARTPPLAVTTRGNHTTLGHGPLPRVTVRNPIDPAGAVWLPRPTAHSRMHAIHQPLHVSRSIELSSESRFPLGKFRVFPAFSHGIGRGAVRDPQKPGPRRRNAHRIDSFPSLAFSGGVSGIPAGQRTGNRSHAQQPHHQPGRGLLLSPGSRGFRTGPTLLIGDERPGKHCRGDGHGTFAVLDRQGEPTHFAGAIRVRIKHVAGSQGNARRREWEPESPFSGTRPFSAGRDGARIPRNTWKARDAFATRRHPAHGEIRSAVRPRCLVPERVGLAITRDGESIERTDVNRILGHDPLPVFCRIHMEPPAASNKSCPPLPFHFTGGCPCPGDQKCHQGTDHDCPQKTIGPAGLAPTPELQLAPISAKS